MVCAIDFFPSVAGEQGFDLGGIVDASGESQVCSRPDHDRHNGIFLHDVIEHGVVVGFEQPMRLEGEDHIAKGAFVDRIGE